MEELNILTDAMFPSVIPYSICSFMEFKPIMITNLTSLRS